MFLKYLDLHNKILRDAEDPEKVAKELVANGYYVVGVNAHNSGEDVKNKENYYKFFESHFEIFEKEGLLMLPAVELKIRDGDYSKLPGLISEFGRKYIPVHHKGKVHHVPFMVFIHGGNADANRVTCADSDSDLLCHPEKEGGVLTSQNAEDAAKNDVGIEVNYREYMFSDDKEAHKAQVLDTLGKVHFAGGKLFLFSATIHKEELTHINDLIEYGKLLHEDLIHTSLKNVHELVNKKYGALLENIEFSIDRMKERHRI
ncbi:MAG: RNase P subunit p30 family protein [Candidatus Woesearchaeota archaeon]